MKRGQFLAAVSLGLVGLLVFMWAAGDAFSANPPGPQLVISNVIPASNAGTPPGVAGDVGIQISTNAAGNPACTPTVNFSGTATAVTNTTLTDTAATWTTNQFAGQYVVMRGDVGQVASNTATVLTLVVPTGFTS